MMSMMLSADRPGVVGDDVDVRVQPDQRLLGRVDLAVADAVEVVQDLALQVGGVDLVHVDDADRADPGGSEVERGRRAETAGAEQQHLGAEQLDLALDADLGEEQVAHVAVALVGAEHHRQVPRATLVLPAPEAARHRHDIGVPELLQRAGGERRANSSGAVHDDRYRLVGELVLDLRLEMAAWDVDGTGERALVVLVRLADVEHTCAIGDSCGRPLGGDLGDLRLGGGEKVSERGHVAQRTEGIPDQPGRDSQRPHPSAGRYPSAGGTPVGTPGTRVRSRTRLVSPAAAMARPARVATFEHRRPRRP